MTYYKIIHDANIVGASTSNSCKYFQAKHAILERTSVELAEYIECAGKLYHAQWMQPIKTNIYNYTVADVIAIEEQEYNILVPAIAFAPVPVDDTASEPLIIEEPINPADEITLEYVRAAKIAEMSAACRKTIEAGFDLELREEIHHFSLDTQDQLNLISLSAMAQTQTLIPYHADGEECIFYSAEEINEIVDTANAFKIYHTTYYNALRGYINTLNTIEDIASVEYGIEIPEEYKTDVLRMLEA